LSLPSPQKDYLLEICPPFVPVPFPNPSVATGGSAPFLTLLPLSFDFFFFFRSHLRGQKDVPLGHHLGFSSSFSLVVKQISFFFSFPNFLPLSFNHRPPMALENSEFPSFSAFLFSSLGTGTHLCRLVPFLPFPGAPLKNRVLITCFPPSTLFIALRRLRFLSCPPLS